MDTRSHRFTGLLATLAVALGTSGCFGGNEHEVTPSRPVIRSFTASPASVATGGTTVLSWTVTDATSLSIAPGLGAVTGTSVTVRPLATTTYTLSATNAGGTSTASVTVTVGGTLPAGLTYSQNPATYATGVAITPNVPSSTGGAITSYGVSPALPSGLALDVSTGVISGTPTVASATAVYTVTGSNVAGSTTAALTLTVTASGLPTIVSFTAVPSAIAPGESSVLSWDVLGATLISIDNGVGPVTGTSTTVTPSSTTTYRLSATNAAGTVTADVAVTVGSGAPANLVYSNATYVVGAPISPNVPTSTGGAILGYAVAPNLPAGLALDTTTGVISGTPTAAAASATYVVTGTNLSGSTTASVILEVLAAPPPGFPEIRRFSATPSTIPDGSPTLLSWDVVNATTLVIEPFIGEVTGTTELEFSPTVTTLFTLSATNATGTTTATVTVTVTYSPPVNLVYATNPATYLVGSAIAPNAPTSGGGVVFSYGVAPALPDGLSLDATTGIVSGTPTTATATATYTVTATNPAGSATAALVVTVVLPDLVITRQPADQSALPPSSATFSVGASGLDPLTYQWRRDGSAIPGAVAASYTTPSLTLADDGSVFDVVVTDASARSVTSVGALLTLRGFFPTGSMLAARVGHTATELASGKVLIAGGSSGTGSLGSAELYDPVAGTFSPTGSMNVAREGHSAVELADGRVLVVGGCTAGPTGCTEYLRSAEIYDPTTGSFTATGSMVTPRTDFAAALVGTKVLVAGGFWYDPVTFTEHFLADAELFEPSTGTFSATSPMADARRYPMTAVLVDGSVLVAGGASAGGILDSVEIYDPAATSFTPAGAMSTPREWGTATALSAGDVLLAGGQGTTLLAGADRYDPGTGTVSPTGALNVARAFQTATLLLTGEVLVAGGTGGGATAEIYDPVSGRFAIAPSMTAERSGQTATLLQDGTVLVAGGTGSGGALSSADLWAPAR